MNNPVRPRRIVHISIPRVPPPEPDAAATAADGADEAGPACGWFESSWALRQGLAVRELGPAELSGDGAPGAAWLAALAGPATESARWQ